MAAAKTAARTATPSKRELAHRHLPVAGVTLIDSSVFDTLQPKTKTEIIVAANGNVEFLPNFNQLKNPRFLREALLGGNDVSRAMEFNGIKITDEEKAAMKAIIPVLEKIGAIVPPYPWVAPDEDVPTNISITAKTVSKGGYSLTQVKLKKWWKLCSAYWAGYRSTAPNIANHRTGSSWNHDTHTVTVNQDNIRVGCQTITRRDLEAVARKLNWEPADA